MITKAYSVDQYVTIYDCSTHYLLQCSTSLCYKIKLLLLGYCLLLRCFRCLITWEINLIPLEGNLYSTFNNPVIPSRTSFPDSVTKGIYIFHRKIYLQLTIKH